MAQRPGPSFVAARAREAHTVGRLLGDAAARATNFRQSLDRIQAMTLLVWGKEDRRVLAGNVQAWQGAIAGATVKMIEGAGYLLLDESAAARAAVAQFLIEATN